MTHEELVEMVLTHDRTLYGERGENGVVRTLRRHQRVFDWLIGSTRIIAFAGPFFGGAVGIFVWWLA